MASRRQRSLAAVRPMMIFALAATLTLAALYARGTSAAGQATDPTIPTGDQSAILTLTGRGVQIYECRQSGAVPKWTFVAPEAALSDVNGAEVGTHAAGPSWTLRDGSSVRGRVIAQRASPNSIPWLLLQAVDPKGPGALAATTFIRRSDTSGGRAPSQGCDGSHLALTARINYTATYTFYGPALK